MGDSANLLVTDVNRPVRLSYKQARGSVGMDVRLKLEIQKSSWWINIADLSLPSRRMAVKGCGM